MTEPTIPRPEHPRPDRFRADWACLNGEWEFAFDTQRVGLEDGWSDGRSLRGRITVPFAHQWALSGIRDRRVEDVVWYARSFEVLDVWRREGRDVLLHFGAVDYRCTLWINGIEIGSNEGGHVPFGFNVAPWLRDGVNRLTLRVEDSLDPHQPRGKQSPSAVSRTCDYYGTTGIWQTVWLESVPSVRLADFTLRTEENVVEARVLLHAPDSGLEVEVEVAGRRASSIARHGEARLSVEIPDAHRWSPDDPHLYDLDVVLLRDGREIDRIASYVGLRDVEIRGDRFFLNGNETYLSLVLDQGYWPDGGLTAPTDEALRRDVELTKALGFNGARKHQKIEDPRWLYWCDRLGLLVWGEMPNARAWSPRAETMLLTEWERAVRRDLNHPCVVTWVPLNESWGVPRLGKGHAGQLAFVERAVALTRRLDGTRPVIDNDGWEHTNDTDLFAIHDYTARGDDLRARYAQTTAGGPMVDQGWGEHPVPYFAPGARYRGQPVVLSEVGGLLSAPPDVPWESLDPLYHMYGSLPGEGDLEARYRDLMEAVADLPFVCGFCTTQLTDVEQEVNGLLTYGREPKIPLEDVACIHREMAERHRKARSKSRQASRGPTEASTSSMA